MTMPKHFPSKMLNIKVYGNILLFANMNLQRHHDVNKDSILPLKLQRIN